MKLLACLLPLIHLLAVESAFIECRNQNECYDKHLHPDNFQRDTLGERSESRNAEQFSKFWLDRAKLFVKNKLKMTENTNKAKNVIFFLGDGLSFSTIAATRVYLGGEEQELSFEKFPYVGLSKTYSVDKIVADSAVTATGYLCGIKANYGTIGVNGHVSRGECNPDKKNFVDSVAKWALDAGKGAGLVTTTRVTHASPAGLFASIPDRNWENNARIVEKCGNNTSVDDIAIQLVHGDVGKRFKVILGGGRREFVNSSVEKKGKRTDNRNLIDEWKMMGDSDNLESVFVTSRDSFLKVNTTNIDRILGLFQNSHFKYHLEDVNQTQPSLAEMTKVAIQILQKEKDGFFLFVEGGKIDIAHHSNKAKLALDETAEYSKAIEMARNLTTEEDTLIVATSDHSHTMSYAGYPPRNNNIFADSGELALDGLPYHTLSYANGKGFLHFYDKKKNRRRDPEKVDDSKNDAIFPSTVYMKQETHGGDDVGVFASGPWAHLFTGVYDQNTIPHMIAYAACIGKGLTACN